MYLLGLMSGTSADGVDATLAHFSGNPNQPKWHLCNFSSVDFDSQLRKNIINVSQGQNFSCKELLEITDAITDCYFRAALQCDPKGIAQLVGCHGQTIFHRPPSKGVRGGSLQILNGQLLAQRLNTPVVYDFRAADIALGGHGAPLVPMLDAALLGKIDGWRGVVNLGGISNITLIPPKGGPDRLKKVLGWDCGPANTLIDLAVSKFFKEKFVFDKDGLIAASGSPNISVINNWLKEPFFQKVPPKSTGRDAFGMIDFERRLSEISPISAENFIATITSFSAAVIGQDIANLENLNLPKPVELIFAGGGCLNKYLMKEISVRCKGIKIRTIDQIGIPCKARESLAFALLAWWNSVDHPGGSPEVTGAIRPSVLGIRVDPR